MKSKEIKKLRWELAKLRLEAAVGKIKDKSLIKKKRKEVARALTELKREGAGND